MKKSLEAVIIGNEILSGRRQDVHFANTLAACEARHLRLSAVHFLSDDNAALVDYYRNARTRQAMVLSFGGIGATPDDRTRQAVAEACGVALAFHPEGDALLRRRFPGAEYNEQRRQLIAFPTGATLIPNPVNGIPGFSYADIHCVPGFPQMATPMILWVLEHYAQDLAQQRAYTAINVFAPESQLSPIMARLEQAFPDLAVSSLPKLHHETELGFDGPPAQCQQALQTAKQWLDAEHILWQESTQA